MKVGKYALLALLASAPAFATESPEKALQSIEESTSPLQELAAYISQDPDFQGRVIDLCVDNECLVLDLTGRYEKGGMAETIDPKSWAGDVAGIVKAATGGVKASADVSVTVTRTETKKDGTSSSTKVEVTVKVSGEK